MIAAANPYIRAISVALTLYWWILLIRVVLSWLELAGVRPPVTGILRSGYELLLDVTEPVLRPLRRIIPPVGMFDISIVVAFVIILVLQQALR
jgi:YggT family protein